MQTETFTLKIATTHDADAVKYMINKMYGRVYETREKFEIAQAIKNKTEIYILAYAGNMCVGFSGASFQNAYFHDIITPQTVVIDYIYTDKKFRDLNTSFKLISTLLKELVNLGAQQAILQVQTFNKQRFFHYALSDKNILKSKTLESKGKVYEDQILLIEDLKKVSKISIKELMLKAHKYRMEEASDKIHNNT